MTTRQQVISKASPQQINQIAQRYGFPSALALQTVIELGSHIQSGGKITDQWMTRIQQAYPAVPRDHLNDLSSNVRSLDDLARVVGVSPTIAHEYVSNYVVARDSNAISQGLEGRRDKFRDTAPMTTEQREQKYGKPSALREAIEAATSKQSIDLKDAPSPVRRETIARGLTLNADLRDARREQHINGDVKSDSPASRAVDVALAYDQHVLQDAGQEELLSMDVEQSLEAA